MSVENQVRYRLLFRCDGCGREEAHQSTWEHFGDSESYTPQGWAHFYGISVILINDVPRTGRELDFCEECVATRTLESLIVKLPFDERALKAIVPADGSVRASGSAG